MKNNNFRLGWLLAAMMLIFVLAACQPAEPAFEGADGERLAGTQAFHRHLGHGRVHYDILRDGQRRLLP